MNDAGVVVALVLVLAAGCGGSGSATTGAALDAAGADDAGSVLADSSTMEGTDMKCAAIALMGMLTGCGTGAAATAPDGSSMSGGAGGVEAGSAGADDGGGGGQGGQLGGQGGGAGQVADTGTSTTYKIIADLGFLSGGTSIVSGQQPSKVCVLRAPSLTENGVLDCGSPDPERTGARLFQYTDRDAKLGTLCLHVFDAGRSSGGTAKCLDPAAVAPGPLPEMLRATEFRGGVQRGGLCAVTEEKIALCTTVSQWIVAGRNVRSAVPIGFGVYNANICLLDDAGSRCGSISPALPTMTQVGATLTGDLVELAVRDEQHYCARRRDGFVECTFPFCAEGAPTCTADFPASKVTGSKYTQITSGGRFFCGVKTDGNVACWGGRDESQQYPASLPPPGAYVQVAVTEQAEQAGGARDLICAITSDRKAVLCNDGRKVE